MIRVEHLTKRFPGCMAVDDITFEVESGEIVGLLGPNGAGKTTTLRVLAGYIPATAGRATVAGFDVFTHSLEARRRIGYLPENVPLYPEMRVDEYLTYRARLKGLSHRQAHRRVEAVKEQCGLGGIGRRLIGHLSKGYRQRVGLADSLVHDPDVLVLDEPTIGLDPNQIREIRELIRGLAKRHTVLISSHILPEVQMTCGRVLIMSRGRIAASGAPEMLHGLFLRQRLVNLEAREITPALLSKLKTINGVLRIETQVLSDGWTRLTLECDAAHDVRADLFQIFAETRTPLRELHAEAATLEDVFVQITRDEERPA